MPVIAACILVGVCTIAVCYLIRKAPITDDYDDEIERVQRIIASAKHHRERLEAIEHELIEMHGIEPLSADADDLVDCVWGGLDYAIAIQRITRRHAHENEK